jgi:hypothetical protein
VYARIGVEAGVRQAEALDRFPTEDVRLNDFLDIRLGDGSVPNGVRVNHKVRPVLALIEAAGLIGPNFPLQAALGQLLFKELLQARFTLRVTTSSRMTCRALVPAHEDVFLKFWHQATVCTCVPSAAASSASQIPSKSTK